MNETGLIRGYTAMTKALAPALPFWLKRRAAKGKEDLARQGERFGVASLTRPKGQLFWMHGASVGEVTMLLPLIDKVLAEYPAAHVLVTSGTTTSAELMEKRLPARASHQYIPLDTPKAVSAFLNHWKPDMALWAESEIWPNMLLQTKARNIPMALINARMSKKSIQGWFKRRKSAKLKKQIAKRPVWCAASTHKGEEEIILTAHEKIKAEHPNALLILALRHPERRAEIAPILSKTRHIHRTDGQAVTPSTSVMVWDTIGEMGLAYSLADISFVCGSLIEGLMGHNPLEPARFSNAVLTGAHISSFADSYMSMIAFDAAQRILSPTMIGQSVSELFSDKEALTRQQGLAFDYAQSREAVLDYVWGKLATILPEPAP